MENDPYWFGKIIGCLQKETDIEIMQVPFSKEQGKTLVANHAFDVFLLDLDLIPQNFEGLDLVREMLDYKSCKIIAFLSDEKAEWISTAIQIGIQSVICKSHFLDLPLIIREASQKNSQFLPPYSWQLLCDDIKRLKKIEGERTLTKSERKILQMISHRYSRKQIYELLHVSESAVKKHVFHIIQKLHVKNGKEAAIVAKRKGWIS